MAVVPFSVLTLDALRGPGGWGAALRMPLPHNPSIELLQEAVRQLLDYQARILTTDSWLVPLDQPTLVLDRLHMLSKLIANWDRHQRRRLGLPWKLQN